MGALKNQRHELFCLAYVGKHRRNASRSYLAAGYKCGEDAARKLGSRLLKVDAIKDRIHELEEEMGITEKMTALDVIRHLNAIVMVTFADFIGENGKIDPVKLNDPYLSQVIKKAKPIYDKHGALLDYAIEMKDSMHALELLGLTYQTKENNQPTQPVLVIKA